MEGRGATDLDGEYMPNLVPKDDDLIQLINTIHTNNFDAWIVGGAVRDLILGKIPSEYDICTNATPENIKKIFDDHIPTGEKYGTITVKSGDSFFEVTTLRTEMDYGDGRRPEIVEWGDSLAVDLSRRDFTINSMAYDIESEILFDPYNGRGDLERCILKAVGDAHERLAEDGLRILRAYRFMDRGEFGVWEPNYALATALVDNRSMLSLISVERIWMEFSKIILGKNCSAILAKMSDDGVLFSIFNDQFDSKTIDLIQDMENDIAIRMTILFSRSDTQKMVNTLKRLKISNSVINQCKLLHSIIGKIPQIEDLRVYRVVIGGNAEAHLSINRSLGYDVTNIEKSLQYPMLSECLVDGLWIMNRTGLKPGIRLGRLKDWLYRIQIERGYTSQDEIEAILCTLSWDSGNENDWPTLDWP